MGTRWEPEGTERFSFTCPVCGRPSVLRTGPDRGYCSSECHFLDVGGADDLAICGGCGAYGRLGEVCYRSNSDGVLEECGTFA